MKKELYFPPVTEVIDVRMEAALLTGTVLRVGRADNEYEDNEMEDL